MELLTEVRSWLQTQWQDMTAQATLLRKRLMINRLLYGNFPINTPLSRQQNVKVMNQIH